MSVPKAMQKVSNRNQVAENYLKKQLQTYDKQRKFRIASIDQEKLDTWEFFKQIKICPSDKLPASKK